MLDVWWSLVHNDVTVPYDHDVSDLFGNLGTLMKHTCLDDDDDDDDALMNSMLMTWQQWAVEQDDWWADLWPAVVMRSSVDKHRWSTKMMSMGKDGWAVDWWQSVIGIKLARGILHLRIWLLKPFLVGAKKTRLGPVSKLVLFLSVGADYNREDCCLPCIINKYQNFNYSCVFCDVMNVLMTFD